MNLVVVGTLAFDSIETPFDRRERILGGSATYFAHAARYFGAVGLVGVVGQDFPRGALEDFRERSIDTRGVEEVEGRSFFWAGRYEADWNTRHTLDTQLNVFADFDPKLPPGYRDASFVFLANATPTVQLRSLEQVKAPKFVVADTMNLWIDSKRGDLEELLRRVHGLVLNDEEARMLSGRRDLFQAARAIRDLGPRYLVIKKGEHGAFLLAEDLRFALPAYPVEEVVDPTGAGDSFAGGFMGFLASVGSVDAASLKRAMLYGTVSASFCVEGFGIERLANLDRARIEARFRELRQFTTS